MHVNQRISNSTVLVDTYIFIYNTWLNVENCQNAISKNSATHSCTHAQTTNVIVSISLSLHLDHHRSLSLTQHVCAPPVLQLSQAGCALGSFVRENNEDVERQHTKDCCDGQNENTLILPELVVLSIGCPKKIQQEVYSLPTLHTTWKYQHPHPNSVCWSQLSMQCNILNEAETPTSFVFAERKAHKKPKYSSKWPQTASVTVMFMLCIPHICTYLAVQIYLLPLHH